MKTFLLTLCLCCCTWLTGRAVTDPSLWTLHLAYHDATKVVSTGQTLYVLMNGNLFAYHPEDQSVDFIDKLGGLSDKGISYIGWSDTEQCLVILYQNNNIDLYYPDGTVVNMPQVKNYTESTIKVQSLTVNGNWATATTTDGVIVLNLSEAEVKGFYRLGQNVKSAVVMDREVYVSLDRSILCGQLADNLYDPSQWTKAYDLTANGFVPYGEGTFLLVPNVAGLTDNYSGICYMGPRQDDGTRSFDRVSYVAVSDGSVTGNHIQFVGSALFLTVSPDNLLKEQSRIPTDGLCKSVAYTSDGTYWLVNSSKELLNVKADLENKLLEDTGTKVGGYGPRRDYCYKLSFAGNRLLVAGGRMDYTAGKNFEPTAMIYEDGKWIFLPEKGFAMNDNTTYRNVMSFVQDPDDPSHHFVSCTSGLLEFRNFEFVKHYNPSNSPIEIAPGGRNNPNYAIVDGLAFDKQGNLWMTNYEMEKVLKVLKKDGTWASVFDVNFSEISTPERIMVDKDNRIWVTSRRSTSIQSGLFALDYAGTVDDTADDHSVFRSAAYNEDGTNCSIIEVKDICQDLTGQIWFGCSSGVYAVENPGNWFNTTDFFIYQPKVPRNDGTNYADYLLTGINVTALAVDQGNRKWLGTLGSGVYLVSPDGSEVIEHFTAQDSPLLSDNIYSLAIHPETGELMIGTDAGLCAYRTRITPTQTQLSKDNIKVYPNPVRPGYSGSVTIAGLTAEAEVKIVSAASQLVARGTATGGSFLWDVKSQTTGKRVAPGVYFILVANADGSESVASKVVVI